MRSLALLLTLIVSLGTLTTTASLGHADVTKDQARKAFADGEAADRAKDYRTAIEHYLRAYELLPHHYALYNIGTDYDRLGEFREAASWFKRYLEAGPPAAEADKVQRLLIDLKLRPATLSVTTNMPGARVFVDGQYTGSTPFAKAVRGGGRRVAVELNGQRDERDVYLEYGEPKEVAFTLRTIKPQKGPRGEIEVVGEPTGAMVKIDDQNVGRLPNARVEAIPGQHNVVVTRYGYQPWTATVQVEPDAVVQVPVQMVREGEPPIAAGSPGAQGPTTNAAGTGYVIPPPVVPTTVAGYVFGFGAGPDLKGTRGMYLVDMGARIGRYAVAFRYGKAGDAYLLDVIAKVSLTEAKLAPFIGGGLSYMFATGGTTSGGGAGLEAVAGVRYDISRTISGTVTLVAEIALRYHPSLTTGGTDPTSSSGIVVPVLGSVQWTYGRRTR